jgi:hypothetical protein
VIGFVNTLAHAVFGPIMLALGITFVTHVFKDKIQDTTTSIIIVAALALMIILEYFIVPLENTAFYILLFIMSLGTFLTFYFSQKPQNLLNKQEKIISWTGAILFLISLFGLMGIIQNNFQLSLIMGAFTVIMIVLGILIRRRIPKDKDDSNEAGRKTSEYWFKHEIGGLAKPVRWQGWVCYGIMFLSPFVVMIFDRNPDTAVVIILAIIFTVILIIMLKSNYRENLMKYREDLKK